MVSQLADSSEVLQRQDRVSAIEGSYTLEPLMFTVVILRRKVLSPIELGVILASFHPGQ